MQRAGASKNHGSCPEPSTVYPTRTAESRVEIEEARPQHAPIEDAAPTKAGAGAVLQGGSRPGHPGSTEGTLRDGLLHRVLALRAVPCGWKLDWLPFPLAYRATPGQFASSLRPLLPPPLLTRPPVHDAMLATRLKRVGHPVAAGAFLFRLITTSKSKSSFPYLLSPALPIW